MEEHHNKNWYDRYYKVLLIIPLLVIALSIIYLFVFYNNTGDLLIRDSTLSGGTTISLYGSVNSDSLQTQLKQEFPDVYVRKITELRTGEDIATVIDSSAQPDQLRPAVEKIIGYQLDNDNSSIEFSGETLGKQFYRQLLFAILFSFILMSLVVFFLFRAFVPSFAVIFAIIANTIMTLAVVDFMGLTISAAGIAAFLMLIGYSVDTDLLLTSRVLKRSDGTVNQRIYGAFKTGIFMTTAGLLAVLPAFFLVTGLPDSFRQIFIILAIGLVADIFNTWLTNASLIKWYTLKRNIR